MEDLDNHLYKLQESLDDMIRLRQLVSSKDTIIKDLRAFKRSVVQELEAARLVIKAAEDTSATLRAQRDKAMDKAVRAGRILMRRPGVVVPDDIVADVNAAPDSSSHPSSSVAPEKNIIK
jgi:hypothetical protein